MKKFLLLAVLILGLVTSLGFVSADVPTVSSEDLSFYPMSDDSDLFTINGSEVDYSNYIGSGYVSLIMGGGNVFAFDVAGQLGSKDTSNLSSISIVLVLGTYYTTLDDTYWNYSDDNLSNISAQTLKYTIDPLDIPDSVTFSIWWAQLGTSGGAPVTDTGGLRFYTAYLHIEYATPIESVDSVDAITDYTLLPDAETSFVRIASYSLVDALTFSYRFELLFGEVYYSFLASVPESVATHLDANDYLLSSGLQNISYSTVDADRMLFFQADANHYPIPDPDDLTEGFVSYNLTTGDYVELSTLDLMALPYVGANRVVYLYMFLPLQVEDLLSVDVSFRYRYLNLVGTAGDWVDVRNLYLQDSSLLETNVYLMITTLPLVFISSPLYLAINAVGVIDTIVPVEPFQLPDDVSTSYVETLGGTLSDLDDLNLYSVVLGQFQSLLTTGLEVSEVVVIHLTYEYQDTVITVPVELIDQETVDVVAPDVIDLPGLVGVDVDELIAPVVSFFSDAGSMILTGLGIVLILGILYLGILGGRALNQKKVSRS